MTLKQHRKSNRYIFSLAFVIALLILVNGGFAYWQMQQVKAEFYEVANRDLPLAAQLLPLIDRQFEQTLLIEKLHNIKDAHKLSVITILEESFIRTGEKFNEASEGLNLLLTPLLTSQREITHQKMSRVKHLLEQVITEHSHYQTQVIQLIETIKSNQITVSSDFIALLSKEESDLTKELITLRDELQRFTQDSAHAVERHEAWVIKGVVLFTLFVFSLGTIMLLLIRQVMSSRDDAIEEINYFASYDPLTDLLNRRQFFSSLDLAIADARSHENHISLCVCDLDHFKGINDSLGHQAGDKVLATFAQLLREKTRDTDFAGRFGGDEFVICFPNTTQLEASKIIERIRKSFAEKQFNNGNCTFKVTATFGVAQWQPIHTSSDGLMESADQALYKAKELGRNRVITSQLIHE